MGLEVWSTCHGISKWGYLSLGSCNVAQLASSPPPPHIRQTHKIPPPSYTHLTYIPQTYPRSDFLHKAVLIDVSVFQERTLTSLRFLFSYILGPISILTDTQLTSFNIVLQYREPLLSFLHTILWQYHVSYFSSRHYVEQVSWWKFHTGDSQNF